MRDRRLRVRVHGVLDLGDALARAGGALDLQRQLHLLLGGPARELGRREPVHLGRAELVRQAAELVRVGDRGRLDGRARDRRHALLAQVGAVGVAAALAGERAHADPAAARVAEALDLAVVDAHLRG